MNASKANLINSITLIVLGIWGYLDSSAMTALIPVGMGLTLGAFTGGIKNGNKIIAHIAVIVTLIAVLGLFMPFKAAIEDGRGLSIFRVAAMLITGVIAMTTFVRSFIANRKKD